MESLDQPATAGRLRRLAQAGLLSPAELELALARAGHLPSPRAWARFAGAALLLVGAALLLAGIFFFFAYNWADLHRFTKFALVQAAILGAAGFALWRGLDHVDAQVALFAACALVGALLGVFGQVYQTGADAFQLTLTWALIILLPAAAARNAPLWMLVALLLTITLPAYWDQRIADLYDLRDAAQLALAAAILVAWELARNRGATWMRAPWYGRALLLNAAVWAWTVVADAVFRDWSLATGGSVTAVAALIALALALAAALYYWRRAPDLPALAIVALFAIAVLTAQLLQWIGWDNTFGVLLVGVLVLGQVAGATLLLRGAARTMEVPR
jgi:uncharacterized membrane protein